MFDCWYRFRILRAFWCNYIRSAKLGRRTSDWFSKMGRAKDEFFFPDLVTICRMVGGKTNASNRKGWVLPLRVRKSLMVESV